MLKYVEGTPFCWSTLIGCGLYNLFFEFKNGAPIFPTLKSISCVLIQYLIYAFPFSDLSLLIPKIIWFGIS